MALLSLKITAAALSSPGQPGVATGMKAQPAGASQIKLTV